MRPVAFFIEYGMLFSRALILVKSDQSLTSLLTHMETHSTGAQRTLTIVKCVQLQDEVYLSYRSRI